MNDDPLDYFSAPDVRETTIIMLQDARKLVRQEFQGDLDSDVVERLGRVFQKLNMQSNVTITVQALMAGYRTERQRK